MRQENDITVAQEPVAQGEFRIERVSEVPEGLSPFGAKHGEAFLIGHSESGNHHLLEGAVEVLERPDPHTPGMKILYAIVEEPGARLFQDAAVPHGSYYLPAGAYEITDDIEYDPFAEQARRVAD